MSTNTGIRIRRIREFRKLTQTQVADKLGVSQNAYNKMENGVSPITTDRLEEIAKILDVPADSMLSGESLVFNMDNNTIEKFYGKIENLHEENKEVWQKTITVLEEQNAYLKEQNALLLKTIEGMSKK